MNKNKNKNLLCYIFLIILLIFVLLFKHFINFTIQSVIVFVLLYLVIYIITNKCLNAFIGAIIIFIVLYSTNYMYYHNTVYEGFDNKETFLNLFKENQDRNQSQDNSHKDNKSEKISDDPTEIMNKLADKLDGGIQFNPDDLNKTKPLNHDFTKNKDEDKDPRAKSQKELYELVDTIKTLQETITTLGPVLSEGRKIMDMFENFKI